VATPKGRRGPKQSHPIIKWTRTAGITTEAFGWGGLLLIGWFWPAAAFIYAGFLLLAIDAWFEPELQNYRRWRIGIVLTVTGFAAAFSWGVVFVKAPLEVSAMVTDAEYPPGTTIAGIAWRPEFTELLMSIKNPSDRSYDDTSLLIRPTAPIAAIAQLKNVPNISFDDNNGLSTRLMDINPTAGKATAIPLILLATDAGYRMRCPHLPAKTTVEVVIALADIKWNPPAHPSQRSIEEVARDKDYVLRITNYDDFSSYWLGHPDGDVYAPRPRRSQWVKVEGEYNAALRRRSISQKVDVAGELTIKQQ
jgi:hypothetical protein